MATRDTVVGIAVLGLVVAGFYLARSPHGAPASSTAASPATDGASGAASEADGAALPDITLGDAVARSGDVTVTASISPRPPVAFAPGVLRVRAERNGVAVVIDEGIVWLEMSMPMGDYRYWLVAGPDGWQQAEVVLPYCTTGVPRWFVNVEGMVGDRPVFARFRVDIGKPAS